MPCRSALQSFAWSALLGRPSLLVSNRKFRQGLRHASALGADECMTLYICPVLCAMLARCSLQLVQVLVLQAASTLGTANCSCRHKAASIRKAGRPRTVLQLASLHITNETPFVKCRATGPLAISISTRRRLAFVWAYPLLGYSLSCCATREQSDLHSAVYRCVNPSNREP